MLFYYSRQLCHCSLLLMVILLACAGYAYRVNARRPAGDPKKKLYLPAAIFLAPVTIPAFILAWICLFAVRILFYGFFLLTFTIGLVIVRKPFIFVWLDKIATRVGGMLLEANTRLIRLLLPQANKGI